MAQFDPKNYFIKKNAPPTAKLFGWKLLDFDTAKGWVKVGFTPRQEFLNPYGFVQGGIICAMQDDTMGPAVLIQSKGKYGIQSIDLHTHFLRPVRLAPITTEATVIQRGRAVVFIESKLYNEKGKLCARSTSSANTLPFSLPEQ